LFSSLSLDDRIVQTLIEYYDHIFEKEERVVFPRSNSTFISTNANPNNANNTNIVNISNQSDGVDASPKSVTHASSPPINSPQNIPGKNFSSCNRTDQRIRIEQSVSLFSQHFFC
jgi:hypothetical protein